MTSTDLDTLTALSKLETLIVTERQRIETLFTKIQTETSTLQTSNQQLTQEMQESLQQFSEPLRHLGGSQALMNRIQTLEQLQTELTHQSKEIDTVFSQLKTQAEALRTEFNRHANSTDQLKIWMKETLNESLKEHQLELEGCYSKLAQFSHEYQGIMGILNADLNAKIEQANKKNLWLMIIIGIIAIVALIALFR